MKWLIFPIAGKRWSVYLVSPHSKYLNVDGEKYVGRCYFETRRIYIDKSLDEEERSETLLHELTHVVVRESGGWELLTGQLGEDEGGRLDEAYVQVFTSHMYPLLKNLGFRFPRYG